MSDRRRCGAHVWRCPTCDQSVAKAVVRRGGCCPRPGCEEAGAPFESTCRSPVTDGALRCRQHGKDSPQATVKQEQRKAEAELDRTVQHWIREPVTDPFEALAAMGGEIVGLKDALAAKVAELESYAAVSAQGVDHVRAEMVLYERALDRSMKFLADWVRLDMEERIVKLRERISDAQAARLQEAVSRALSTLPAKHREGFRVALAHELRAA